MNSKQAGNRLQRIAEKVLTQGKLGNDIIVQEGNSYLVFGKYKIDQTDEGWRVQTDGLKPRIFHKANVALAWCIYYRTGRYQLADNMHWIDGRIVAKQQDIDALTIILNTVEKLDNRAILLARLTEDINSRQSYKKQLAKCLETAKYIKLKGTYDELNRSNKTSKRNRRF